MTDGARAADQGLVLLNLGRPAEAETHLRRALATDPANPDLLVHLARSLHAQDRYDEARDAAHQALAADPEHLDGLMVMSAALGGLRDFDSALRTVDQGLQIAPALPAFHRQRGAVLLANDRAAEALPALERARALDPEDADTVALTGAALFGARRFPEAESAVTDALRLDPGNLEAHRLRGLLELRRGGGKAAVESGRSMLRLDPTDPHSREQLAVAMKSRNPLYGLLLRFSDWMSGLSRGARLVVLLSPLILSRVLRPFDDQLWAQILIGVVVAAVVLSWSLEPLMNTVLLGSAYARNLLPPLTKLATYAFLAYVGSAIAAAVVGLTTQTPPLLVLAVGLGLWAASAGQTHLVAAARRRLAIGLQGVGAMLAVIAATAVALDSSSAFPALAAYVVLAVAMLWFTALA